MKVFDEEKAIQLMKKKGFGKADAGLEEDWFYTAGEIQLKGDKLDTGNAHLSSTWATPVIKFKTFLGEEIIECFKEEQEVQFYRKSRKKAKVWNILSKSFYEFDCEKYIPTGEIQPKYPSSWAIWFNKKKNQMEGFGPHLCPTNCPCRKNAFYKAWRKEMFGKKAVK